MTVKNGLNVDLQVHLLPSSLKLVDLISIIIRLSKTELRILGRYC